jgi:hypothetical protein
VTALIVMVSALLALSHVLGPAYNYIVRFTWTVGMFVTVIAFWGAVVLLQPVLGPRLVNPSARRALAGAAVVVLAALAIPTLWQGRSDELPDESVGRPLTQIMAPLDEWATVHEIRAAAITAGLGCSPAASGVAVELQRRGIAIRLNGFGKIWPSEFHQDAQPSFARVALVCGAQAIENHRRLSPDDLVAKYTPTATDDQSSGVPAARDVPVGVFANAPT